MKKNTGVTLIELLIVVAIVGILAAIATPSYRDYIRRGEQSSAQQALMGLAQAMEQFYAQNLTYTGTADGDSKPTMYPSWAPTDGPVGAATYNLTISLSGGGTGYTLRATYIADTDHWFQYTSIGQKSWHDYDSASATYTGCWNTRDC